MNKENINLESKLHLNNDFEIWCNNLAKQILKESILNETELSKSIKDKILMNESFFYECLANDLDKRIYSLKNKLRLEYNSNKKKYVENSFILSNLKARQKKYNIERNNAYKQNRYYKLVTFLKDNGYNEIFDNFKIKNK